jgi:glutathione synthetase, prokaryotic
MTIQLGVVMDPIGSINPYKDSTLAMLIEAQGRGWSIHYMEQADLFLMDGRPFARMRGLEVRDTRTDWYTFTEDHEAPLDELDVILMRKDPPFDMEYIYTTYLLERAESYGVRVVNQPAGLRAANEKLYTAWFSHCCPPTLVSRNRERLRAFLKAHSAVVVKPLNAMGGKMVFVVRAHDLNTNVIFETLTENGTRYAMAQRYLPEVTRGDKRILLIDGEPVPYALARLPPPGEARANLAVGGIGEGVPLTVRDRWICEQVGPRLRALGLLFVGLDVIGDYLTEINVTSPTCIRELDKLYELNISAQILDRIGMERA